MMELKRERESKRLKKAKKKSWHDSLLSPSF